MARVSGGHVLRREHAEPIYGIRCHSQQPLEGRRARSIVPYEPANEAAHLPVGLPPTVPTDSSNLFVQVRR